jgi:hypothetical protein
VEILRFFRFLTSPPDGVANHPRATVTDVNAFMDSVRLGKFKQVPACYSECSTASA